MTQLTSLKHDLFLFAGRGQKLRTEHVQRGRVREQAEGPGLRVGLRQSGGLP